MQLQRNIQEIEELASLCNILAVHSSLDESKLMYARLSHQLKNKEIEKSLLELISSEFVSESLKKRSKEILRVSKKEKIKFPQFKFKHYLLNLTQPRAIGVATAMLVFGVLSNQLGSKTEIIFEPQITNTKNYGQLQVRESFLKKLFNEINPEFRAQSKKIRDCIKIEDILAGAKGHIDVLKNNEYARAPIGEAYNPAYISSWFWQDRTNTKDKKLRKLYRVGGNNLGKHYGWDFILDEGDTVVAAQSGKILFAEECGNYGNAVIQQYNDGIFAINGHFSEILVQPNQYVFRGESIGLGGETGRATGPHLHYETRQFKKGNEHKQINSIQDIFAYTKPISPKEKFKSIPKNKMVKIIANEKEVKKLILDAIVYREKLSGNYSDENSIAKLIKHQQTKLSYKLYH